MPKITLKPGRERSLLHFHPWIFSGAVDIVEGEPQPGADVEIYDSKGQWLAIGAWSPISQIRARVWTFKKDELVDGAFFESRISDALEYRRRLGLLDADSCRLIHGEADGLPALVVDKYGDYLSCQFLGAGTEYHKSDIVNALLKLMPGIKGIYERSDNDSREREGLPQVVGNVWGEEPPTPLIIEENGLKMSMNLAGGHKTGYYLDQRENRRAVMPLAKGADVLDCCCYAGGFGLLAAKHGAKHVTFADAAESSLDLVRANAKLNNLDESTFEYVKSDVFQLLRKYRDSRKDFDLIVLDPPKFAATQARLAKAAKGYKDINLLAMKLLRKGGTLLTFSCSAAMTPEFFRTIIAQAAADSGRRIRIVREFAQGADHPQSPFFPEGVYLCGLQLTAF